jgi:predicted tellurium resistance membrane protein TerC
MPTDLSAIIISLLSLTVLEIILGIDNLVFISILVNRAPEDKRVMTMRIGLTVAWATRLILLACANAIAGLSQPIINIFNHDFSGSNLFMLFGGLFLFVKAIHEIHCKFEEDHDQKSSQKKQTLLMILTQIAVLDVVFSIDSILTAIGLTQTYWIMATAITIAILIMIFASKPVHHFIHEHPSVKMLALSFLLLIGIVLIADGMGQHIEKGYLYFAICFSLFVESLNIKLAQKKKHN